LAVGNAKRANSSTVPRHSSVVAIDPKPGDTAALGRHVFSNRVEPKADARFALRNRRIQVEL
jgi:hypothetical protein